MKAENVRIGTRWAAPVDTQFASDPSFHQGLGRVAHSFKSAGAPSLSPSFGERVGPGFEITAGPFCRPKASTRDGAPEHLFHFRRTAGPSTSPLRGSARDEQ